ncbi:hypothetical protein [Paenibacillus spongiae]|uniref:Uncharacterized protein n=1 Tax=Paenibacillus spongiae TaxID=2909671 RepID=A0ABY5SEK3_9BACL|nr:hypothetical protein [Paenibacillus spongiae]UVI32069.1 hypothetical protein L1F29_09730 [Paenibacillus spongiae]
MKDYVLIDEESETYQIIKDLWEDYKEAVRVHGYGAESKKILIEINSLYPNE